MTDQELLKILHFTPEYGEYRDIKNAQINMRKNHAVTTKNLALLELQLDEAHLMLTRTPEFKAWEGPTITASNHSQCDQFGGYSEGYTNGVASERRRILKALKHEEQTTPVYEELEITFNMEQLETLIRGTR